MKPSPPLPVATAPKPAVPSGASARRGGVEGAFDAALGAASNGSAARVDPGARPQLPIAPEIPVKAGRPARRAEDSPTGPVAVPAAGLLGVAMRAQAPDAASSATEAAGTNGRSGQQNSTAPAGAAPAEPGQPQPGAAEIRDAQMNGDAKAPGDAIAPVDTKAAGDAKAMTGNPDAKTAAQGPGPTTPAGPDTPAESATPLEPVKKTVTRRGEASTTPVRMEDPVPAAAENTNDVQNAPGSRAALHARAAASPRSELAEAIAQRAAAEVQEMHAAPLQGAADHATSRTPKHEAAPAGAPRFAGPAPAASAENSSHANPDASGPHQDPASPSAPRAGDEARSAVPFEAGIAGRAHAPEAGGTASTTAGRASASGPATAPAASAAPPAAPHAGAVKILDQVIQQLQIKQLGPETMRATVRLNPESLGQVEIRIEMQNGHLRAHFVAASPEVREALRQHLPELERALAAGRGSLSSLSVDVGRQGEQPGNQFMDSKPARMKRAPGAADVAAHPDPRPRRDSGLDLYA